MTATTAPKLREMLLAYELTPENKAEYIRLIFEGHRPNTAAKEIGSTGTQFRRLRNPTSEHYDAAFAKAYKDAITSEEHRSNHLDRIRDMVWTAAENGNARLLEKLSLVYDPDWEPLKHSNLRLDVNLVARLLPYFSTDELDKAIEAAEREQVDPPNLHALPSPTAKEE